MIDINNRKFLYSQLEILAKDSSGRIPLISKDRFLKFSDEDLIKYMFNFRKTHVVMIDGEKVEPYYEFPDMDLEGVDLSGVEFAGFVPGIIKDGEVIKSKINLKGTNAIVNLSRIYNTSQINHGDYCEYITDLSDCDFRGCNIYGRSQAEIKEGKNDSKDIYTFISGDKLDKRYILRRKLHNVNSEKKAKADEVYAALIDGKNIFDIGSDEEIDLTDYDFSNLSSSRISFIKNQVFNKKINLGFTALEDGKLGYETPRSLNITIKDALQAHDDDTILEHVKKFSGAKLNYLVEYLYSRGKIDARNIENYTSDINMIRKVTNACFSKNPKSVPERLYKHVKPEYMLKAMDSFERDIIGYLSESDENIVTQVAIEALKEKNGVKIEKLLRTGKVSKTSILVDTAEKFGMKFVPEGARTPEFYSRIIERNYRAQKPKVENTLNYLDRAKPQTAKAILDERYGKNKIEIVEKYYYLASTQTKLALMRRKNAAKDYDFVLKNLKHIPADKVYPVFDTIYNSNSEIAIKAFESLTTGAKKAIANSILDANNNLERIRFAWKHATDSKRAEKIAWAVEEGKEEYLKNIQSCMNQEEKLKYGVLQPNEAIKIVSKNNSGKYLLRAIQEGYSSRTIRTLIDAGIDVEYEDTKTKPPKSVLEYAIELENFSRREAVLYELFRGNVNIRREVDYRNHNRRGYIGKLCNTEKYKSAVLKHLFVRKFLKEELAFSDSEINDLRNFFESNEQNFKELEMTDLNLKKLIFDACNVTDYVFRENPRLLFTSEATLYSRFMFFKNECGIAITSENFLDTVGLTNREFSKRYGNKVISKDKNLKNRQLDSEEIRRILIERYAIPRNIKKFKENIMSGENEMIYIKEDRKNGNMVHVFEKENRFSFENSRVLPAEQRDLLLEILNNVSKKKDGELNEEYEMAERERISRELLKRLQDPRLEQKARITTLYSEGGALSGTDEEKDAMKTKGAKVEYLAIDINGFVILEPFGQLNNATLLTPYSSDVEEKLTEFGRRGVLDRGFFKIIHDKNEKPGYNYESDHILSILDMTIEDKDLLLSILKDVREKDGKQYCSLKTIKKKFYPVKAGKDFGLTRKEVLGVGEELLKDEKIMPEGDCK